MELLNDLQRAVDPELLIRQFGYLGLFLIVFAESGLFFGFFLPGDSLLLIAGVLAGTGFINIAILIPLIFTAAFLGDQVGYWMGHHFGPRILKHQDSWLFRQEHVRRSEDFFAKHGHKTIVLGRFVPIVRTFAPILAGASKMPYGTFVTYNFIGAVLWGIGLTLVGYLLGNVPSIERWIHYIVGAIIVVSILPVVGHVVRSRAKR